MKRGGNWLAFVAIGLFLCETLPCARGDLTFAPDPNGNLVAGYNATNLELPENVQSEPRFDFLKWSITGEPSRLLTEWNGVPAYLIDTAGLASELDTDRENESNVVHGQTGFSARDALNLGFQMSIGLGMPGIANLNEIVEDVNGAARAIHATYYVFGNAFRMNFSTDSNGDPVVGVALAGTDEFSGVVSGGADQWHDYTMIFDPSTETVDVFVDQAKVLSDVDPTAMWPGGPHQFEVGDCCSGTGDGIGYFAYFNLYVDTLEGLPGPFTAPGPDLALIQPGDANLDGEVNSLDIILSLAGNKYETGRSATWEEGDWNAAPGPGFFFGGAPPIGDGVFDSNDIVAALAAGLYETGPYAATGDAAASTIPEPCSVSLLGFALIALMMKRHAARPLRADPI